MAYTSPFIGFAGSPKDYSSLEMARKRQAAAENKTAKGLAKKEMDEIYKATSIDPKGYLPFRLPQIKEKFAEGIAKMGAAISAQDYNALQEAKNEIIMYSGNFAAEKQDFDKVIKSNQSGATFSDGDYSIAYSASSINDLQPFIDSGAMGFQKETERVIPIAYDNVDIPLRQLGIVEKYNNMPTTDINSLGQQIFKFDVQGATNALANDYDTEAPVRRKFRYENIGRIPKEGKSPEQIEAELRQMYINKGLSMETPSTTRNLPKQDIYNFNLGKDGEVPPVMKAVKLSEIKITQTNPFTGKKEVGVLSLNNSRTLGDAAATIPKGVDAYYADTGDSASDSDLQKATFNEFGNAIVFNKDVTVNTPNGRVTYKKGSPILQGYESWAILNGYAKPAMLVSAQVDGRYIMSDARRYMQTKAISASKDDEPIISANLNEAEKDFEQFEKDFKKREADLNKAKADREKKSQSGGQPKTTQNKSTSAKPLSKEAQKRSSGNASLQKLIQQNQK
jgi:hypothetical protein